jgi:hypothetical protein
VADAAPPAGPCCATATGSAGAAGAALRRRRWRTCPALADLDQRLPGAVRQPLSDFGAAAGYYIRCYETALETGQLRMAITAATNIGEDFTILNDHHAALEWMQSALDLARPTGWPRSVGACLMHTADTMRRLGQLDATEEC